MAEVVAEVMEAVVEATAMAPWETTESEQEMDIVQEEVRTLRMLLEDDDDQDEEIDKALLNKVSGARCHE